jgi:hypothetical protein
MTVRRLPQPVLRASLCVALALASHAAFSQDAATRLLKTSRVKEFRLIAVSQEGGKPTAVLQRTWKEEEGAAVALDPRPSVHAHVGDGFSDGHILEIRLDSKEVVVRQELSDPRLVKPYRDIVFTILPARSRPELSGPPLEVTSRRRGDAMVLEGRTWPSCRVQLIRGEQVLGETRSDLHGGFEFPLDADDAPIRIVARGMARMAEWQGSGWERK